MDNIHYNFIDVKIPDFNPEFFDLWLSELCSSYGKVLGELSYVFCSDDELLKINVEHLNHDYYTDIITFNYNDKDSLSGDVFISYERVCDNAEQFGNKNVYDELCRVMAHGLLHLIGFNDKTEEEQMSMSAEEEKCLSKR